MEEILDVWWPKLEEKLKELPPPPEPAVARSTSDQLEELLHLARENLRRENLRLEASMDRDEKLGSMIGILEQAGMAMRNMQTHAQNLQLSVIKPIEHAVASGAIVNAPDDLQEVSAMVDAMSRPVFSAASMSELTETLRGMHERDIVRTESMLGPSQKPQSLGAVSDDQPSE